MSDRPEDVPQWAWEQADQFTWHVSHDGQVREQIARALLKAREEAFEEAAMRILSQRYVPEDMRRQLASAIRQHSQKGEK